ncbi:hypothetical protein ACOMHN_042437 [Nucella lapillus]
MALQVKALHRLCRSLRQANVSGVSEHGGRLGGSTPRWLHRCLSSSSSSSSPHPAPTPPCFFSKEGRLSVGPQTDLNNTSETGTGVNRESHIHGKLASDMLGVNSKFTGLSLSSHDVSLGVCVQQELNLASWPNPQHLEYVCPSEKLSTLPDLAILEQVPQTISYDLPQTSTIVSQIIDPASNSAEISEPTTSNTNAPVEARQIMKIRRKKMKRHLLKKFRKRMAFTLRKIKRDRRKKKEAVFQARLATIRDWGDSFTAKDWVQEQLDKARKGGFYINVLEKRQQN